MCALKMKRITSTLLVLVAFYFKVT